MAHRSKQIELRDELRDKGMRATPSRIAVLDLLRSVREPMSHSDVADRLEQAAWDRATIYRNLVDLAEVGLLRRTDVGDHVWRFEAIGSEHEAKSHPHFVCTACGTVECLSDTTVAVSPAKTPRAVRRREVEVHLRGLCDDCR
ncbi:MAG TPA: transcriptional repressor [Kofleriaceae bacterium]|jgi:Fur family ferric uptake transcriptional regulator